MGHWDRSAGTIFCLHPLFTSTRRKRATVNPAVWQSLQVCSEAEKCCNKQVLLPSITPFILHLKCSGLLALLSVKSPSSCLTLLREHDRHPCHSEWLQHSDAPNLSFRQVNLWIIYFYVVSKSVDSSQVRSPTPGSWGGQDSLLPAKRGRRSGPANGASLPVTSSPWSHNAASAYAPLKSMSNTVNPQDSCLDRAPFNTFHLKLPRDNFLYQI